MISMTRKRKKTGNKLRRLAVVLMGILFCHVGTAAMSRQEIIKSLKEARDMRTVSLMAMELSRHQLLNTVPLHSPIDGKAKVTSPYGWRLHPITGRRTFHRGVDLSANKATPVLSTADGVIRFQGRKGSYGNCIIITHAYGLETLYAHLSRNYCRRGMAVHKGQIIGFAGSTGQSTGDHLHYEIRKKGNAIRPVIIEGLGGSRSHHPTLIYQ